MKKFLVILGLFTALGVTPLQVNASGSLEDALNIGRDMSIYKVPKMFHTLFLEKLIPDGKYSTLWTDANISIRKTARLIHNGKLYGEGDFLKKNTLPCRNGEVAVGINDQGFIRCGTKQALLAVDVWVRSGTLKWQYNCGDGKCHTGEQTIAMASDAPPKMMRIEPNQTAMLSTDGNQAEITFSDGSMIRLDTNTKIELKPISKPVENRPRTIAQASYKNGLLWGRVLSDEGPQFAKDDIIAGVRGTSLAITADGIYALQSRNKAGAVSLSYSGGNIDMNPCSKVNTSDIYPVGMQTQNAEYCLGAEITYKGRDDIITEHTKKDIAYLNALITEGKDFENLEEERKISGPETIQPSSPFCTGNNNGNVFWPNVTDASQMCQDEKVYAMVMNEAKKDPILYYLDKDGRMTAFEGIKHSSGAGYIFNISEDFKKDFSEYFEKRHEKVSFGTNNPTIIFNNKRYYRSNGRYLSLEISNNIDLLINIRNTESNLLILKK